mgnify:CR=1 FL=1
MEANEVIIRPLLTEKSYSGIQNKIYSFVVNKKANKVEIAQAVETMFNVEVAKVNTINVKGHKKSQNTNKIQEAVLIYIAKFFRGQK